MIEISKGSKNKYEIDKSTGMLVYDGFIPRTHAEDDDPLDVMVLCSESILPMTLVECHAIGVLKMIDQGQVDEKVIAVGNNDPDKKTEEHEIQGQQEARQVIRRGIECNQIKYMQPGVHWCEEGVPTGTPSFIGDEVNMVYSLIGTNFLSFEL